MEKHNGFETEKGGRNGNHGLNGHGTRTLPPDGMYHTSDVTTGLESGMVDKVILRAMFLLKKRLTLNLFFSACHSLEVQGLGPALFIKVSPLCPCLPNIVFLASRGKLHKISFAGKETKTD